MRGVRLGAKARVAPGPGRAENAGPRGAGRKGGNASGRAADGAPDARSRPQARSSSVVVAGILNNLGNPSCQLVKLPNSKAKGPPPPSLTPPTGALAGPRPAHAGGELWRSPRRLPSSRMCVQISPQRASYNARAAPCVQGMRAVPPARHATRRSRGAARVTYKKHGRLTLSSRPPPSSYLRSSPRRAASRVPRASPSTASASGRPRAGPRVPLLSLARLPSRSRASRGTWTRSKTTATRTCRA